MATLLWLVFFLEPVSAIVLRELGVPAFAVAGKEAVLNCNYDLEGSALYSVKWYKNGLEFFRYLPGNPEPITVYARPGVEVSREKSGQVSVHLNQLTPLSTGRYRCEVSTEGPSFATVSSYGDMIVVVLPDHEPIITGGQQEYREGELVDVTCVSGASRPAPDLSWFVNDSEAASKNLITYPIEKVAKNGLYRSRLGLRFVVGPNDIDEERQLRLRCTAEIDTVYFEASQQPPQKQKRASKLDQFESNANCVKTNYLLTLILSFLTSALALK